MRRNSTLWLGLVFVYAALIAWRQPLRGPLSEDKLQAAFSLPVVALCGLLLLGVMGTRRARHRADTIGQRNGFDATRRS